MQSLVSMTWFLATVIALGAVIIHGDPEPMARPTRPKVFTSPEELRRYLELVKDYYSLSGKARYGKRGDTTLLDPNLAHPWDALRMILEARRRTQQHRLAKDKQEKDQIMESLESIESGKQADTRPTYYVDRLGKYYDELQ